MSAKLLRRVTSPAARAANRNNAKQSTGPSSERGKSISRYNAARHWGRAEGIRQMMPVLGEDPAEYEAVRDGLYHALGPCDEFEAMLVDDMTDIHWRLRRMIKSETAAQADSRRTWMQNAEVSDTLLEVGRFEDLDRSLIPALGFFGLEDSPPKFFRIIEILKAFRGTIRDEGFPKEGVYYLKVLYGRNPGLRATCLISDYESCSREQEAAGSEPAQRRRAAFLERLEKEIAWFEERAESHRQFREDIRGPRLEATMLRGRADPRKSIECQASLERSFERKWKMLMAHRAARQMPGMSPLAAAGAGHAPLLAPPLAPTLASPAPPALPGGTGSSQHI